MTANPIDLAQAKLRDREPPQRESRSFDAADLVNMNIADPIHHAGGWVPEGLTIICSRPKFGKTTLIRQLILALNKGGLFFGERCSRCSVLFLSLEEGERLMRKKLAAIVTDPEDLRGIRLEFEWPRGPEGVVRMREWLATLPPGSRAVIIVDCLTRFRVPPSAKGNAFAEDYNAVSLLAELCKAHPGLAVLVIHHTTKAMPEDPVSSISGTYGLTAAVDGYLIMLQQGERYRLHAGGRLWENEASDFKLRRENGGWSLSGEWDFTAPVVLTPKQRKVVDALSKGAMSSAELVRLTGQEQSALSHQMKTLQGKGLVTKGANGWELVQ